VNRPTGAREQRKFFCPFYSSLAVCAWRRRWRAGGSTPGSNFLKKRTLGCFWEITKSKSYLQQTMGRYTIRFELICGTKIAQAEDTILP